MVCSKECRMSESRASTEIEEFDISDTKSKEDFTKRSGKPLLTSICSHRHFTVFILLVAIFDAFIVATELTTDIMGIITERQEFCDVENIIEYLYTNNKGRLDELFSKQSIDDILETVENRNSFIRHRRDVLDVFEVHPRTTRAESSITTPSWSSIASTRTEASFLSSHDVTIGSYSTMAPPIFLSDTLFTVSHSLGPVSILILVSMSVVKIISMCTLRKQFFRSKHQVLDTVVIFVSIPFDIAFQPHLWMHTNTTTTAIPILFDVISRVIRVVICCVIYLHEKDHLLLAQDKERLRESVKQYKALKKHVLQLRELALASGGEVEQVLACTKIVKKKYTKETSLTNGVMSVNSLAFLSAPKLFPKPNQHSLNEKEENTIQEDETMSLEETKDEFDVEENWNSPNVLDDRGDFLDGPFVCRKTLAVIEIPIQVNRCKSI